MRAFIIISILFLNIVSIFILLKMQKGLELGLKLKITGMLIIIDFIITLIICGIGQAGVASEIAQTAKPYMLFIIFPINLIVMASPLAVQISQMQAKDANREKIMKNIIGLLIFDVILVIVECIYVKNTQMGIANMKNK